MKLQRLGYLKRKVCSVLVLTLLLVQSSLVLGEERLATGAGVPALFIQDANIYSEANTESTVLKTMQKHQAIKVIAEKGAFYKLDYCNKAGYVLKDSVLTHNDLEDYVFKNANLFSYNVIVTTESANLIDPGSGTAQVSVTQGERFIVLDEEQYFYTIMYNDKQFLLYKQDAKREYYVKITDFIAINKNESKREQITAFAQEFLGKTLSIIQSV